MHIRIEALSMRFVQIAAVLCCSVPAFAQYSAQRDGDVVRLEDTKNQTAVSIVTSVGDVAFEMRVRGTNVLYFPFASLDEFKSRPSLSGIPFLGPWANRLDEDAFYANGKKYIFNMELGNVRGAIPIHGFLSSTNHWQVVEAKADRDSAWVTSELEFYRYPDFMAQFPFAHTIEITHRLKDGVLEVSTKVQNLSAEPMPLSIGFHPYYHLTDSPREDWTLKVGARNHWLLAPAKIPTGEMEPIQTFFPNPDAVALKDFTLDDVFGDLIRDSSGRAMVSVQGKVQKIEIAIGPNYHNLVLFSPGAGGRGGRGPANGAPGGQTAATGPSTPTPTGGRDVAATDATGRGGRRAPQDRNFIAVEPMVGVTDAINLAHKGLYRDLQFVAPGQTWQESFWVRPSGF
jgi:aldose 1-epimerase